MVGTLAAGVGDGAFGDALLGQGVVVRALVGKGGGDEELLHRVLVFSVEVVELAGAGGEQFACILPGAIICPVTERAQVGDVSCRTVQTAVEGEAPVIIELVAQVERGVKNTKDR